MNFKNINLENDNLKISVLPELGAKITSLFYKPSNKELLWKTSEREFRKPNYGDIFEDYDMSGFDECFPTIDSCEYPPSLIDAGKVPDHGELWTQNWEYESDSNSINLKSEGVNFPYTFRKGMNLDGNRLNIAYSVTNQSAFPWQYLWAAHPLFSIDDKFKINLPENTGIRVSWDKDNNFCPEEYTWPYAVDKWRNKVDFSRLSCIKTNSAIKLFTTRLKRGWVELVDEKDNLAIEISFPECKIPYLGLWFNQGGWPSEKSNHYNLALEPTTSPDERLDNAIKQGTAIKLAPYEVAEWNITIEIKE